jgi:hypothetical protein
MEVKLFTFWPWPLACYQRPTLPPEFDPPESPPVVTCTAREVLSVGWLLCPTQPTSARGGQPGYSYLLTPSVGMLGASPSPVVATALTSVPHLDACTTSGQIPLMAGAMLC